jgi:hypothetical protein
VTIGCWLALHYPHRVPRDLSVNAGELKSPARSSLDAPRHFWALTVGYRDDYSAAQVPMLPSIADMTEVTRDIFCYRRALVASRSSACQSPTFAPTRRRQL